MEHFFTALRLLFVPTLSLIFFLSAGRWDLPFAWAYWGMWIGWCMTALVALVVSKNFRALAKERSRPGLGSIEKNIPVLIVLSIIVLVSHWAVAGLDVGRFHWSDTVPFGLRILGLLCILLGMSCNTWAGLHNPFASSVIRLQDDRGHHVITSGPYQFVRHPGYAGGVLILVCGGLALGSWLAMLPLLIFFPMVIARTKREDEFLNKNLDGYITYASQVQYRLLPGVW